MESSPASLKNRKFEILLGKMFKGTMFKLADK